MSGADGAGGEIGVVGAGNADCADGTGDAYGVINSQTSAYRTRGSLSVSNIRVLRCMKEILNEWHRLESWMSISYGKSWLKIARICNRKADLLSRASYFLILSSDELFPCYLPIVVCVDKIIKKQGLSHAILLLH